MSERDEQTGRQGPKDAVRNAAIAAVDRLLELHELSDPAGGAATANGKDRRATQALNEIEHLTRLLAFWAVNHRIGLALNGLNSLPIPHPRVRGTVPTIVATAAVDDHRHETLGTKDLLRPKGERLHERPDALRAFLREGFLHRDHQAAWALRRALDRLDEGEVDPVLKPKRARPTRRYQRAALEMVAYREGKGARRAEAEEEVATAFGAELETLEKWRSLLKKELGDFQFHNRLAFPTTAGRTAQYLIESFKPPATNDNSNEDHDDYGTRAKRLQEIEDEYGAQALSDAGEAYRKLATRKLGPKS